MLSEETLKTKVHEEDKALNQLERQLERGSLFTHTIVSRNAERIHEAESFLYGLIDLLLEKGVITGDEVVQFAQKVRTEMDQNGHTIGPGIALRIDNSENQDHTPVPVNCSERLPICKAICCKLHFALSADEIESGNIKWDIGEPYYIRQGSKGYCCHNDSNSKGCSIYENRPHVCKQYSCAQDERIWKDFDKMILNDEWLNHNLTISHPRLASIQMVPQNLIYKHFEKETKNTQNNTNENHFEK